MYSLVQQRLLHRRPEAAYPGYEEYLYHKQYRCYELSECVRLTAIIKRKLYAGFQVRMRWETVLRNKLNELLQKYTMVSGLTADSVIEITGIITRSRPIQRVRINCLKGCQSTELGRRTGRIHTQRIRLRILSI